MTVPEDIAFLYRGSAPAALDAATLYRHLRRCQWSCSYCALLEDGLNEQGVDARDYQEKLGRSTYRARFQELWGALRYRRYRDRMRRAVIRMRE